MGAVVFEEKSMCLWEARMEVMGVMEVILFLKRIPTCPL